MKRRRPSPKASGGRGGPRGPARGGGGRGAGPRAPRGSEHGASHGQARGRGSGREEAFDSNGRWVIGLHSCMEAIRVRPHAIAEVFFRPDWSHSETHREMADLLGAMDIEIRPRAMEQLNLLGSGHQGVALRLTESPQMDWEALAAPGQRLMLILDGIEDPHNLGSILRTAWLTGVNGVLIPEDRAVGLTPTVCKIASGGAEHVPVESHSSFGSSVQRLKDLGFWVYGLAEAGRSRPYDLKLPEKVAWVVGSEGRGLRVSTERLCDELVRLPQVASGSSYNASIAVAMALAETCRQFGKPE